MAAEIHLPKAIKIEARERLFVGLRLGDGVRRDVFYQRTGFVLDDLCRDAHGNVRCCATVWIWSVRWADV